MTRAGRIEPGAIRWISVLKNVAFAALVLSMVLSARSPANADVSFYLAPQFGISGLLADTNGRAAVPAAPRRSYGGEDRDEAPLLGLGVGLELPMDELVPREWLADVRLPNWTMRFELEAIGLRDYDFRTNGAGAGAEVYTSEIQATTLMANTWLDIPLLTLWRPAQYVFGLGRQPRVGQWLGPMNFYLGAGIGFVNLEIDGTDNVLQGKDDFIDFAWNVGAGLNYKLTDRVSLTTGYRYVGLGASTGIQEVDLVGSGGPIGTQEYDLQVHEFRAGIEIRIFSFRGAWR